MSDFVRYILLINELSQSCEGYPEQQVQQLSSGATQQYEDEFWKEKANNMAETIDSLTI